MAKDKAKDAAWHREKYWADETVRERRRQTARAYYKRRKLQNTPTEHAEESIDPSPVQV
jgi:hypothetical protein